MPRKKKKAALVRSYHMGARVRPKHKRMLVELAAKLEMSHSEALVHALERTCKAHGVSIRAG